MPDGGQCQYTLVNGDPVINYVFLTRRWVNGDIGGPSGADALCQAAANDAGIGAPNMYRAFISVSVIGARDRIGGTGARGWIRRDGCPVADTIDDLVSTDLLADPPRIFYPPITDEWGAPTTATYARTGATHDGGPTAQTCSDFTSANGMGSVGTTGRLTWLAPISLDCASLFPLYCFGISHQSELRVRPIAGPRRVFLSSGVPLRDGGVAAADALCNSELGSDAGFVALLASDVGSAASRVPGPAQFVRTDGVIFMWKASPLANLDKPRSFLNVLATGAHSSGFAAWTGSTDVDEPARQTCGNWTGLLTSPDGGLARADRGSAGSLDQWFYFGSLECNQPAQRVYCFER